MLVANPLSETRLSPCATEPPLPTGSWRPKTRMYVHYTMFCGAELRGHNRQGSDHRATVAAGATTPATTTTLLLRPLPHQLLPALFNDGDDELLQTEGRIRHSVPEQEGTHSGL